MKTKYDGDQKVDGHLRVLVVDDSGLVRQRLCEVVRADGRFALAGFADNGRSAVQMAAELCPDLVLMDVRMPEMNGLEATRRIKTHPRAPTVIIVTLEDTPACRTAAKVAGADGFISKRAMGKELPLLLSAMCRKRGRSKPPLAKAKWFGLGFSGPDCSVRAGQARGKSGGLLTPRERQIVQLIAEGRSSKQVADRLAVSVKTVDTHRYNLMRKLNLHSAIEVALYAIRNKLAEP